MSTDIVNMVIDGMSKYNHGLALLITGLDESGAHGNALKKYRNSSKL
jgi:hypothetical protein